MAQGDVSHESRDGGDSAGSVAAVPEFERAHEAVSTARPEPSPAVESPRPIEPSAPSPRVEAERWSEPSSAPPSVSGDGPRDEQRPATPVDNP
jgi:hypothetical protein